MNDNFKIIGIGGSLFFFLLVFAMGYHFLSGNFKAIANFPSSKDVDFAELAEENPPYSRSQLITSMGFRVEEEYYGSIGGTYTPKNSSGGNSNFSVGGLIPVTSTNTQVVVATDYDVYVYDSYDLRDIRFFRTDEEQSVYKVVTVYPGTDFEDTIYEVHLSLSDYLKYAEDYALVFGKKLPLSDERMVSEAIELAK